MAIDKQTAPLDSPASLTDWQRLIDITDTLALSFKNPWPVKVVTGTGYIIRGSVFYIGGAWYKANIDVAITGTETDYIQLTVDNVNNLVTAAYVATLTDVSWNDQWNGWYDTTGKFYVFDEVLAYSNGQLTDIPRTVVYSRPRNPELAKVLTGTMGDNWANSLSASCDPTDLDLLTIGLPNTLYTTFNRTVVKSHGIITFEYGHPDWTQLFSFSIKGGTNPVRLKAMRLYWTNDDSANDNYVRIMRGTTEIYRWNDGTQKNMTLDLTSLDLVLGSFTVEYKEDDATATRGPMSLTISCGCADDTNKPTIMEHILNVSGFTVV